MKFSKTLVAAALVATAGVAQADLSANIAASSNYLFRGVTQTGDSAAVSGGIDYTQDSGFYAGTWISNIDFSTGPADTNGDGNFDVSGDSKADAEVDLYAGFGGDLGDSGLGYDVGVIYYYYPGAGGDMQGGNLDYSEVNGSVSFGPLTGSIAYTFWGEANDPAPFHDGDIYYKLAADLPFEYKGFTSSAFIGRYDFTDDGNNKLAGNDLSYTHWGVSVSKNAGDYGSVSVNYEQVDDANDLVSDDNPNLWLGWSKDF